MLVAVCVGIMVSATEPVAPRPTAVNAGAPLGYSLAHVIGRTAGYVNGMAGTPDGSLLVVASDDGRVTVWDTHSGNMVRVLRGHNGAVYAVAISPDAALIATGGLDETIRLWELSSGRELRALTGHHGWINAVAFTSEGRKLVSAGRDRTVRTWDVQTGKLLRTIEYPSEVFTVATSSGTLFASDKGNSFSIREIGTGKEISSGTPGQWGINTVVFSPSRPLLMSSGYDGVLWVWNILEAKLDRQIRVEGSPIISLATTENGSLVAALCSGNASLALFDTNTWNEVGRLEGVKYPVGSVVLSADGGILAAAGGDSPIRIWKRNSPR